MKITHGRHCTCSACAREDWTQRWIAPCGMHGSSCPREYQPLGLAGALDEDDVRIRATSYIDRAIASFKDKPSSSEREAAIKKVEKATQVLVDLRVGRTEG